MIFPAFPQLDNVIVSWIFRDILFLKTLIFESSIAVGQKERSIEGPFLKADRWFCNFEVPIYFYYFTYGPLKSFGCSKPDAGTYPVRDWANHGDEKDFVFGNYEKSDCPMDAWEALEDKNQCSLSPQSLNLKDLFHHTSTLQMGRV